MIQVKVKKLHENAVLPYKKNNEDFCYDMTAISCEEVLPGVYCYGTGIAFEIDRESSEIPYTSDIQLDIDGRPRSSIYKTGMILCNCEATIDESYRGEVKFMFYHLKPELPKYEIGDRIAQIKLGMTESMQFKVVDELSQTNRGEGGFGSTGKK